MTSRPVSVRVAAKTRLERDVSRSERDRERGIELASENARELQRGRHKWNGR